MKGVGGKTREVTVFCCVDGTAAHSVSTVLQMEPTFIFYFLTTSCERCVTVFCCVDSTAAHSVSTVLQMEPTFIFYFLTTSCERCGREDKRSDSVLLC